jgi:hypothetical protein
MGVLGLLFGAVGVFIGVRKAALDRPADQESASASAAQPWPSVARSSALTKASPAPSASVSTPAPPSSADDYPVDLAQLRSEIPDNLYWENDAPTEDAALLLRRETSRKEWNELFGKVQSNSATEAEIRRYFEHKRKLSQDYLELTSLILTRYGPQLPERDRGLYTLGAQLHRGRLGEIDGELRDALARKQQQDAKREAWLRSGRP